MFKFKKSLSSLTHFSSHSYFYFRIFLLDLLSQCTGDTCLNHGKPFLRPGESDHSHFQNDSSKLEKSTILVEAAEDLKLVATPSHQVSGLNEP